MRIVTKTFDNAFSNVALEEAMFNMLSKETVRVWENQECIVIGSGQLAELETDLNECSRLGIPVVRRFTGGGAVYNGPGNINWSFFLKREGSILNFKFDPGYLIKSVAEIVMRCVGKSVECFFVPPGSIWTSEGKICGISAYLAKDKALVHGTLLSSANLDLAERLTRPAARKAEKMYVRSKHVKIANSFISKKELLDSMIEILEPDEVSCSINEEEEKELRRLNPKYSSQSWNLGDPFLSRREFPLS